MDAITIKNVTKTYKDDEKKTMKALDRISFNVKKGEIFGLLGANGAGKTTLISILCGLVSKDSGNVTILGKDLDNDIQDIKKDINIVSGFTMLGMLMSVEEYLRYFTILYDVKNKKEMIDSTIKKVGLEKKRKVLVDDLSSGYKQRVLLAKALINSPKIIYMDEPTVGLDVSIAIKIRKIIQELQKKGTTFIFTSHNLSEVEQLCDRIALVKEGKLLHVGSIEDIKKSIKSNKLIEVVCKRNKDFINMISRLSCVISAKEVYGKIIIETKNKKDVQKVMSKAISSDHIIISIRKIEPTLEEAFLNIMNKR